MKHILSILIALVILSAPALAEDGILRVALTSLGDPQSLTLTLCGAYAVEGDAGFRFEPGATLHFFQQDGEVWMAAGGAIIDLGARVTLTRHAVQDGEENGIRIADNENLYEGDLTLSARGGGLRPILNIQIEDYLKGVVAYEMSDSFPLEALKAQAIAARTYAMNRKAASSGRAYDLTDTTSDQVFKGYDPKYLSVLEAVSATAGVVGLDGDAFAECYYTASNGGQVARPRDVWGGGSDMILLRDDPYDLENPRSLVNAVTFRSDLGDCPRLRDMIESRLPSTHKFERILSIVPGDPNPSDSRRYTTLSVQVEVRTPEILEETVTLAVYDDIKDGLSLGLNKKDCELIQVTQNENTFTLEMRRFGHGAGMSQRGAQCMAGQHGMNWEEILAFYYPGMTLKTMNWQIPPLAPPKAARTISTDGLCARVSLSKKDSSLNLRQRPTVGARILARLADGQPVTVLGDVDPEGWAQVRIGETVGYVKAEFLTGGQG